MATNININQFAQGPVRGLQDQQISHSGVIQGQVSANNTTTTIGPGDCVDLDSAITVAGLPQFITAAYTDVSFGYMIFDPKSSATLQPGIIQVAMRWVGPTIWLTAAGTITPGSLVEQAASGGDVVTYGTSSSKVRGVALDYATVGVLLRVVLAGAPY